MVRVGIIGCGRIAQVRHLPEYKDNADAQLIGYFDFNYDRACGIAQQYGGRAYSTIDDLLNDRRIDAVSVCVANNAHADISIRALNAGKHVLCEKPMATTIEDCEAMVKAARENGKYLMVDQNQRLARAHVKAKELIEDGIIGKVLTFRTTFGHKGPENWSVTPGTGSWFFDKRQASMGAMADLGVHKTDLIQYLLNGKVIETRAMVTTLDKRDTEGNLVGVDDNAICLYRMDNGIIGTMTASWTYYGREDNSTILYGTDGIMKIYASEYSVEIQKRNGDRIFFDIDKIQTNDNQTKSGVIDAFVDAVENDHEPIISGQSVLAAMRTIFANLESEATGQTVKIDQTI